MKKYRKLKTNCSLDQKNDPRDVIVTKDYALHLAAPRSILNSTSSPLSITRNE